MLLLSGWDGIYGGGMANKVTEVKTTERFGPMTGIGLMIDPVLLARLDRLRACAGESRGKIIDGILRAGLGRAEKGYGLSTGRFATLAEAAGVDWQTYAQAYAIAFARQTYPPTVALLADERTGAEFRAAIDIALREITTREQGVKLAARTDGG